MDFLRRAWMRYRTTLHRINIACLACDGPMPSERRGRFNTCSTACADDDAAAWQTY